MPVSFNPSSTGFPSLIVNSQPSSDLGVCVLFFVPFSGNLGFCPAEKVPLQFPSVMVGSNKYGGLGPCARYPDGTPGLPILDEQLEPVGL